MDTRGGMATPSIRISASRTSSSACRPFTTVGVGKGSVPTSPSHIKQTWPLLMKRAMAESHLAPFIAYATPSSGTIDHWKKVAKKAELELLLERDGHRADNSKNNTTIHRINRRLIPLEKALGKSKENLKQQEKLISYLKRQLTGADEKKNTELSYLQSQAHALQERLVAVTQTSEHKIRQLQEELHLAESQVGTLQAQMNEIYKNVDEAPEMEDMSSTAEGSSASPNSRRDISKNVQRSDKLEKGLAVLTKIHKMRLTKQQFGWRLKKDEEQILLMVRDNDRLRRLAQDAISRSNKFMDLAHTLKADRDWTMSRLKDTEDIIKALEGLRDLVDSYVKTVSPRHGNCSPGTLVYKSVYARQASPPANRKAEDVLQIETTDPGNMRAGNHSKVVYFKDDGGANARNLGTSLLKKLQEVFQALALKVDTANQAAKMVRKEREEVHVTILEAFQELSGHRTVTSNSADNVALGVLLAAREVKQTLEVLKKEKAILKASGSVEDEKLMQLQSQLHDLSLDRMVLLETLEAVKSISRASNAEQGGLQRVKGFFERKVIHGENVSEVFEMVERLVTDRDEARSMSGALKEGKFLKEKELNDLKKLYAQSQTLVAHLQAEKDALKKERNEVKANCQDLTKEKISWEAEMKRETDKKLLELQNQVHDLVLDRTALLETLEAIKNAVKASNSGHGAPKFVTVILNRPAVHGLNVSDVVEMVEELVRERDEAKHKGRQMMEHKEKKMQELHEIKKLYAQSQDLSKILEEERNSLKHHIGELEQSANVLKTERDSCKSSSLEMEEIIKELRNQNLQLRAAFLETVESLRNIFEESNSKVIAQNLQGFLHNSIQGENVSVLLDTARMLVHENSEARSGDEQVKKEREIRENELSELRHLYSQLESSCKSLQKHKDLLEREMNDLQNTFKSIERSLYGSGYSLEPDLIEKSSTPLQLGALRCQKLANEVSVTKQNADAAENERKLLERRMNEMKQILGKENEPSSDWESDAAALILSLQVFKAEMEQLATELTDCQGLHGIIENHMKELLNIMRPSPMFPESLMETENKRNLSRSEPPIFKEDITVSGEFGKVATYLPELVEEVRTLKSEKDSLVASLQFVELEKEAAVRRSNEDQDRLLKMSDCSQQEVNELKQQLQAVLSFINSVTVKDTGVQKLLSGQPTNQHGIQHILHLEDLDTICKELISLRAEKFDLEVKVNKLLLHGGSEKAKVQESAKELSLAEAKVQKLSVCLSTSESQLQSLESQNAAVEGQLSELISMMMAKDPPQASEVQTSNSDLQHLGKIIENIQAIKRKVSELQLAKEEGVTQRIEDASKWRSRVQNLESQNAAVEGQLSEIFSMIMSKDPATALEAQTSNPDLLPLGTNLIGNIQAIKRKVSELQLAKEEGLTQRTEDASKWRSRVKNLESQNAAVEGQLSELCGMIMSKGPTTASEVQTSNSDLLPLGKNIIANIQAVKRKVSQLQLAKEELSKRTEDASTWRSRVQSLENQNAAVESQLSELFTMIKSKAPVQASEVSTSNHDAQPLGKNIMSTIKAVKREVFEFQLAKEEEVSQKTKDASKWKVQVEALEREGKFSSAEVEKLREKLNGQEEFIKQHTLEWMRVAENLKNELIRLGGSDPKDEGEKLRKSRAAEKVKELISPALVLNPPSSHPQTSTNTSTSSNPLLCLAKFQVDLLVNSKVHSQLKVAGHNGGLCQAVLHYFAVDPRTGNVTFENATVPGSQSSNLVVDLFLLPVDDKRIYQTQTGDTLGLCIKVSALNDPSPREVLFKSDLLSTDEVMEAIHGQMIQNFSLWPDLMGSWRWERDIRKGRWSLVSVRWRFLLKNVFPDLSAPLQDLTIKGVISPRSSSIHIL